MSAPRVSRVNFIEPGEMRRLRVLFVCAMNQWRSPTAERLYCTDARLEVRSAGTRAGARRRVSEGDLRWADVVFVMEREQGKWIIEFFSDLELPPIRVLDVPDEYSFMDDRLQEELRRAIDPELVELCGSGGKDA